MYTCRLPLAGARVSKTESTTTTLDDEKKSIDRKICSLARLRCSAHLACRFFLCLLLASAHDQQAFNSRIRSFFPLLCLHVWCFLSSAHAAVARFASQCLSFIAQTRTDIVCSSAHSPTLFSTSFARSLCPSLSCCLAVCLFSATHSLLLSVAQLSIPYSLSHFVFAFYTWY